MAERRMFTKKVTDDDNFMALSSSAQALYLHLSMSADDDGFCNQVSISMFKAHASVQDLQALLEKRYVYQFENGVIVIKHWRMANALRKDRYTPTIFQEELSMLDLKDNGTYDLATERQPNGNHCLPQVRLGKDSIGNIEDTNVSSCSEAKQVCSEPPIVEIVLNDGSMHGIYQNDVDAYKSYYPAIDIVLELRKAAAWCYSNPSNRKTKRGVSRFINGWLSRAQDKAPKAVDNVEKEYF